MSKELAKIASEPIKSIARLTQEFDALESQVNLVTPVVQISHIPDGYGISMRVTKIIPGDDACEVYQDPKFCDQGEVALTKKGLMKIWRNAGGSTISSKRVDDRSLENYIEWETIVELTELDGKTTRYVATKVVDFRDGSAQMKNWKPNQIDSARMFIDGYAQAKSMNRAIRQALFMKQKYNAMDLEKPFVVPALTYMPDMSDPEIKRLVAQKELGLSTQLYGEREPEFPTVITVVEETGEVIEPVVEAPPQNYEDDVPEELEIPKDQHINDCPCGDKTVLNEVDYQRSMEKFGCARTGGCIPNMHFDVGAHSKVASLKVPKRPKLCTSDIRGAKARAHSAARRKAANA